MKYSDDDVTKNILLAIFPLTSIQQQCQSLSVQDLSSILEGPNSRQISRRKVDFFPPEGPFFRSLSEQPSCEECHERREDDVRSVPVEAVDAADAAAVTVDVVLENAAVLVQEVKQHPVGPAEPDDDVVFAATAAQAHLG